ncbi:hypothetical protein AJ80_05864 [Polytolypa hystricis UAMH7299]|uniref:dipeptidyl-peptidase IV n=1 Tax=Polytolypa hystricis (strain UAMH7299) TaxID=1447883 RepID=A0A2B7XRZ7_POLH7|nr:hypothetical protein AJ80_05864 [Polytolypa hystricis UAMH7299]
MKALYLLSLVAIGQAIDIPRKPYPPTGGGDRLLTFNETVPRAAISPSSISVDWIPTEDDGQYVVSASGSLLIQDIATGENKTLVSADKLPEGTEGYWIKPDLSAVLFATNYTKQYRHSYFADYLILDVDSGSITPLAEDQAGDIQYAAWSPIDNTIAYVRGNNLFIWANGTTTQITSDGGENVFNGVPDWVYEEEIFGSPSALWFSPDGKYIAFLRFDETGVPTFTIPYYMNSQKVAPPYPRELDIRYPKVSETNPTVQLHLLDLGTSKASRVPIDVFAADDLIIGEVSWITDSHDSVLYRAFNRVQDKDAYVSVDTKTARSKILRKTDGTDGWLDNSQSVQYIGKIKGGRNLRNGEYYAVLSDEDGWNHVYLVNAKTGDATNLTPGKFEVTTILHVDTSRQLIYYLSTQHHSTERHLYSVSYRTFEVKALVDDKVSASWSASFSPKGDYYILNYNGPDVPYQELYSVKSKKPLRTITSNSVVIEQIKEYRLPKISFFEITVPSGETLNVMQRLPANFSPDKKYPVLFTPYGGPGAQEVSKSWKSMNWNAYIASDPELEFVTWTVDNRGTGYKGRKFRSLVAKKLGLLEAEDQIFAAKELAKKPWVDASRIGIWGWSYGGYLSAKVLEADSGVFSFGLITAPVADWRFYDTMYTERYMKTLELNEEGYKTSAVHDHKGFHNVKGGFLIQHGTGDDNVHFQNAAALVDLLMGNGVPPQKMQVQWFTDSDHSINYNGGSLFLYKQLTERLFDEKTRDVSEEPPRHQWSKKGLKSVRMQV